MKNIFILGVLAIVCFTVAGVLSTMLNTTKIQDEKGKDAGKKKKDVDETPAVRTTPTPSSEEIGKMASEIGDRRTQLSDLEKRLDQRQMHLELVMEDIGKQREQLTRMLSQIVNEMKFANEKSSELDRKYNDIEDKRKQLEKENTSLTRSRIDFDKDEQANIAKMSALYDSMAPENAAKILQQMSDTGKMDVVVKILSQMKQTKASKVLSEMPDIALASQLTEKVIRLRKSSSSPSGSPSTPAAPMPNG